ncbi:hypothetical protein IFM89_036523 [Coptis chinensis]|uniref:INO80 complex subunit B-like conserved region domain-containing protein n=1 Tax=Coptis chinensis TaxID=261450 RepID=A0A835H962_9MAGN|nr:hypothetical protein IFM89_036523 [Coptis chinensis]
MELLTPGSFAEFKHDPYCCWQAHQSAQWANQRLQKIPCASRKSNFVSPIINHYETSSLDIASIVPGNDNALGLQRRSTRNALQQVKLKGGQFSPATLSQKVLQSRKNLVPHGELGHKDGVRRQGRTLSADEDRALDFELLGLALLILGIRPPTSHKFTFDELSPVRIQWKDFSGGSFSLRKKGSSKNKMLGDGVAGKKTDKSEPVRKSRRVPKLRVLDEQFDDGDNDEEIRYLEKLRSLKVTSDCYFHYADGEDKHQRKVLRDEKLTEVEQQLKKAEAAPRRRVQVAKAAKEFDAEAIRKILGQDSNRKKREDKLKKRRDELAQGKAANA